MKWFALAASIAVVLLVSPVQADVFERFESFVSGGGVQAPIQADGKIVQGPAYKHVQSDCGCSHKGAFGHAGCGKGHGCCDGIWNGYRKPCRAHSFGHKGHGCGKGGCTACQAPCHSCKMPQFHMPKVKLPKVHVQVDWPSMHCNKGCCAPSWRRQSVPACHHGLNWGWMKRGHHGCHGCGGCDSCSGKAVYGGKTIYGGKYYDGSELPAVPQIESDVPAPALEQETSADTDDNSARLVRPFFAR